MVKEVNSVKDINDSEFLIKYGQDFCIPCEMTENNLKSLDADFSLQFYTTKNVDESIEKGFKALPVIEIHKDGKIVTLTDNDIMMDESALKDWISKNA